MDTFTFAEASTTTIPVETEIVRTSGYSAVGKGAALYVADANVTSNSRSTFVSSNGRGFRLARDQEITPYMFGASGYVGFHAETSLRSDLPDDTAALAAFFNFCSATRLTSVNWGGTFGVTGNLTLGDTEAGSHEDFESSICFRGGMVLVVKDVIAGTVLTIRNRRLATYEALAVIGTTKTGNYEDRTWADRLFDIGVLLERQSQMQRFGTITVTHAKLWGVVNYGRGELSFSDNVYANDFGTCYFSLCGSGFTMENLGLPLSNASPQAFLSGRFGAHNRHTFNNDGTNQFSRIGGINVFPPQLARELGAPIYVRIQETGDWHRVTGNYLIEHKAFDVFPWMGPDQTGTVQYVFGGGLLSIGGDAGMAKAKVSSHGCAIGVQNVATYGGDYQVTSQLCCIGYAHGKGQGYIEDYIATGGRLDIYCEDNTADLVYDAIGALHVEANENLQPAKIIFLRKRNADFSFVPDKMPAGLAINSAGVWLVNDGASDAAGGWHAATIAFDRPVDYLTVLRGDNPTVTIANPPYAADLRRLFGYRVRMVNMTGSGAGGRPTGTLTVTPHAELKINGGAAGAAATFSGFTGPVLVRVELDPTDASNCIVSFLAGRMDDTLRLRAAMQHATFGTGVQQAIPAATFTTIELSSFEDNRNAFSNTTRIYTIPETGTYDCHLKVKPVDSAAPATTSYGIGIDTANQDSVSFFWSEMNSTRQGIQNRVVRTFAAGDQVRAFIYSNAAINLNGAELSIRRVG